MAGPFRTNVIWKSKSWNKSIYPRALIKKIRTLKFSFLEAVCDFKCFGCKFNRCVAISNFFASSFTNSWLVSSAQSSEWYYETLLDLLRAVYSIPETSSRWSTVYATLQLTCVTLQVSLFKLNKKMLTKVKMFCASQIPKWYISKKYLKVLSYSSARYSFRIARIF